MSFWTAYYPYKKIVPKLHKALPHITQLMVQIKPQHIKNTIIHITKTPVPLSDPELLNAFLPLLI